MSPQKQPWDDWIPGVLSKTQIEELIGIKLLSTTPETDISVSSLDLTLSSDVYELPEGTIKPSAQGPSYLGEIQGFSRNIGPMNEQGITLSARKSYLVQLRERLHPKMIRESGIHGQATAKSSVGRVDVLARLIVDGMNCYESFSPDGVGSGELFLEVTPLTFPVRIRPGISLSQLRLFYGVPQGCQISGSEAYKTFLKGGTEKHDGTLSADLSPTTVCGCDVIAFRARETEEHFDPVALWKGEAPAPWRYWAFVKPNESKRLSLKKGNFYILKSKELLALPSGVAVYCRAIDESFGEMRIHYAGFAHPWFGRNRQDGNTGTPLIFEVRGHDVNVSLQDGESMARLMFYRMSKDSRAEEAETSYSDQSLQLSKFFSAWPDKVTVDENGVVTPVG